MGLLDDAIREHLELKRRRGADPTEIERAEREALGPVRKVPEPIDEAGLVAEPPPPLPDAEFDEALLEPLDESYRPEEPRPELALEPEPPEPIQGSHPAPTTRDADLGDPLTQEYSAFAAEAEEDEDEASPKQYAEEGLGEAGGDEMLEETPEFLQDTPDHDRLWFEQGPPRDFDLDN